MSEHKISALGQAVVAFAGALTLSVAMVCGIQLAQATGLLSLSSIDCFASTGVVGGV